MEEYFHNCLARAIDKKNLRANDYETFFRKNGLSISQRSVYRYTNAERVPSFKIAKKMLRVLGVTVSDDELNKMLENSNETRQSINDSLLRRRLDVHISTNLKSLTDIKATDTQILIMLNNRVKEVVGSVNYPAYIKELIKQDLDEAIARTSEEREENTIWL